MLSSNHVSVDCPPGKVIISGGARTGSEGVVDGTPIYADGGRDMNILDSFQVDNDTWFVRAYFGGGYWSASALSAVALCVNAP